VRRAKAAEDLSRLGQLFVFSDWNGNEVILAADRPVSLMPSLAAIRSGFKALLDRQIVSVFSPLELECLICDDSEFPVDRMKERFHFQNGTEEDRERLITVLGRLTSDERFQLLAFCTGTPRLLPPGSPQPEIRGRVLDSANLPIAHNCFSKLELSRCESADDMEKKIRIAIELRGTFQLV
jgi:hypothetical protein